MDQLGLTNDQLQAVQCEIQITKDEAFVEAEVNVEQARTEARTAMKAAITGCKKPVEFNPDVVSISNYLSTWEPFRKTMHLDGQDAVNTFITYFDTNSRKKVVQNELHELASWERVKQLVMTTLSTPTAALQARYQIM